MSATDNLFWQASDSIFGSAGNYLSLNGTFDNWFRSTSPLDAAFQLFSDTSTPGLITINIQPKSDSNSIKYNNDQKRITVAPNNS